MQGLGLRLGLRDMKASQEGDLRPYPNGPRTQIIGP